MNASYFDLCDDFIVQIIASHLNSYKTLALFRATCTRMHNMRLIGAINCRSGDLWTAYRMALSTTNIELLETIITIDPRYLHEVSLREITDTFCARNGARIARKLIDHMKYYLLYSARMFMPFAVVLWDTDDCIYIAHKMGFPEDDLREYIDICARIRTQRSCADELPQLCHHTHLPSIIIKILVVSFAAAVYCDKDDIIKILDIIVATGECNITNNCITYAIDHIYDALYARKICIEHPAMSCCYIRFCARITETPSIVLANPEYESMVRAKYGFDSAQKYHDALFDAFGCIYDDLGALYLIMIEGNFDLTRNLIKRIKLCDDRHNIFYQLSKYMVSSVSRFIHYIHTIPNARIIDCIGILSRETGRVPMISLVTSLDNIIKCRDCAHEIAMILTYFARNNPIEFILELFYLLKKEAIIAVSGQPCSISARMYRIFAVFIHRNAHHFTSAQHAIIQFVANRTKFVDDDIARKIGSIA